MAVSDGAQAQALSSRTPFGGVPMTLVSIGSVQFGAALARTLFDELGAAGTVLVRIVLSAIILLVVWRPSLRGYERRHLRLIVVLGLLIGTMNLCVYEAFARIPLGIAITIEFVGPLGLAVALSRRRWDLLWAALAAIGILLLAGHGGGSIDPLGVVFALVAGAGWAAYILLAQAAGRVFVGGRGVAMAMTVAVLVPLVPGIASAGTDLLEPQWLALGLVVAIMSSVLPYSLETEALRRLPAHVFGILMSLEPAVAALAGFIVLNQKLGARDVVAIGLVVAASIGVTRTAPQVAET